MNCLKMKDLCKRHDLLLIEVGLGVNNLERVFLSTTYMVRRVLLLILPFGTFYGQISSLKIDALSSIITLKMEES